MDVTFVGGVSKLPWIYSNCSAILWQASIIPSKVDSDILSWTNALDCAFSPWAAHLAAVWVPWWSPMEEKLHPRGYMVYQENQRKSKFRLTTSFGNITEPWNCKSQRYTYPKNVISCDRWRKRKAEAVALRVAWFTTQSNFVTFPFRKFFRRSSAIFGWSYKKLSLIGQI